MDYVFFLGSEFRKAVFGFGFMKSECGNQCFANGDLYTCMCKRRPCGFGFEIQYFI